MGDADVTAKRARESDPVNVSHTHFIHKQLNAGVKGGFGELNLADVGLGNDNVRVTPFDAKVEDVRPGATFLPESVGSVRRAIRR